MTKASDNIFPKITFVEGSAPSSPSASDFHLYFDSADHLLKWKNSAGTVTTIATGTPLTDPMTTRGDIIVRNASNVTARLAVGGAGTVLSSDGTDVSWAAGGGGGGALVLLEQHTASSSASLDFTTFISSTYDTYLFEFIDVLPATNATWLIAHAGTGGGPTWDTGSNYSHGMMRYNQAGAAGSGANPDTSMWMTNGTDTMSNDASFNGTSGFIKLYAPQSATYKKLIGEFGYKSTNWEGVSITAIYQSTTAMTGIRFKFVSGNIASGTIRAYGITK